jgi:hypothetical protein
VTHSFARLSVCLSLQCFFSISFPPYTSRAALKEKLLYAMNTCQSMDGDVVLKDSELYDWAADDIQVKP